MNLRALGFVVLGLAAACGEEDVDLQKELGKDAGSDSSCGVSSCGAADTACTSRTACCSGLCEPESEERKCQPFCKPLGAQCEKPSDCCSLGCSEQNHCTTTVCAAIGDGCKEDVDCCSSHCDNGSCVAEETACRRTAERCAQGGDCCSGVCDPSSKRCDVGPGQCRPPLFPCTGDSDCCAGACVANAQGIAVCASSCFMEGAPCSGASDCCSGACTQNRCSASCEP